LSSKIRFLQATGNSLDAWCSNRPLWKNCQNNTCSQYYDIDYGSHSIIICNSGSTYPSYNSYAYFPENSYNTLVASGRGNINLFVTPDGIQIPTGFNKAYIRFINLAADEPCLDFRFSDGILAIARNIQYQETTAYYPITAGNYRMQAFRCGSNRALLNVNSINLSADISYTFYITGSLIQSPCYNHLLCVDAWPPRPPRPPQCCGNYTSNSFYADSLPCCDNYYY